MLKKMKFIIPALLIILILAACSRSQEDNKAGINEPDNSNPAIDKEEAGQEKDDDQDSQDEEDNHDEQDDQDGQDEDDKQDGQVEQVKPFISVDKIQEIDVIEISDWLDEQNIIVTMENKELEKMSLLERSDRYSRGLYLYDVETKEAKPLSVRENMFLGGAKLSADKNHLLYYEYSIGDNAYYVMNMEDEDKEKDIKDKALGLAITAKWTDDNDIVGVSYAGGAYRTDTDWKLIPAYDLQDEQLYTLVKSKSMLYYITIEENMDMYILNLTTNNKKKLDIKNPVEIIPSPDGEKLLIGQSTETDTRLHIIDRTGEILKTLAQGVEISGESWSPDGRMIAYQLSTVEEGAESKGLFVYDLSSEESIKIADNISTAKTVWSPSGDKIALTQYSESGSIKPFIIYLKK